MPENSQLANEANGEGCRGALIRRRDMLRKSIVAFAWSTLGGLGRSLAFTPSEFRVIQTTHGKIRGRVLNGHAEFKGLSYAAPTHGVNRFCAPQPVREWKGVRDALSLGKQCFQVNPDYPAWLDRSPMSEDCLVLNVWTPEHAGLSSRLPVMVWMHGGGFSFGSAGAELYEGGDMARAGNVVVVGINHRLGIFGYSYMGNDAEERFAGSANVGHLDLVKALEWVRDNIHSFGGDSGNVTIFGESGGGGKVSALMGMEAANGLFHKAIVESGSMMSLREEEEAVFLTDLVYTELGIKRGDIGALQQIPAPALLKCWEKVVSEHKTSTRSTLRFRPTVDRVVFPNQPWSNGTAPINSRHVPLIVGTNLHETAGFARETPETLYR